MKKKVAIVGDGTIGKLLKHKLEQCGVEVFGPLSREAEGESTLRNLIQTESLSAVGVTISTRDTGEAARGIMLTALHAGLPVITCEKASLAYHAEVLKPYFSKIGYSATVGGGTRMLRYVAARRSTGVNPVHIEAVLNGTLNFIFDEKSVSTTLEDACQAAYARGYTEPGSRDPIGILNRESRDVILKTCGFFNTVLAKDQFITPDQFSSQMHFDQQDIESLDAPALNWRMTVTFSNYPVQAPIDYMRKRFALAVGDWRISGGFRCYGSGSARWLPSGAGNAVRILESEGLSGERNEYTLSGPGAGPSPTVRAMIADFNELCP